MGSLPKGPNGRALCRQCNVEVPTNRRTFCSDKCVDAWKIIRDPTFVRIRLFDRDHGICSICKINCVKLVKTLERLDPVASKRWSHNRWEYEQSILTNQPLMERLQELRISVARYRTRRNYGIWDADHIKAVVDGGGECGLDNYRTLCCQCHYQETTKLAGRRSKEK